MRKKDQKELVSILRKLIIEYEPPYREETTRRLLERLARLEKKLDK